ncbi:MAG: hypothetical protein L3J83_11395 [Proteobacteria bacterium]|nr:hypothetical protein [Pseudomonadota bacterium]
MKKLILSLAIIFATNSFGSAADGSSGIASAADGSSGIASAADGSSGIASAGEGSSGIASAGDGSSSVTSIGNIQLIQLGNGFVRSCFQMRNNTTACTISRR